MRELGLEHVLGNVLPDLVLARVAVQDAVVDLPGLATAAISAYRDLDSVVLGVAASQQSHASHRHCAKLVGLGTLLQLVGVALFLLQRPDLAQGRVGERLELGDVAALGRLIGFQELLYQPRPGHEWAVRRPDVEGDVLERRDLLAGRVAEHAGGVHRDTAVVVLPTPLVGHGQVLRLGDQAVAVRAR